MNHHPAGGETTPSEAELVAVHKTSLQQLEHIQGTRCLRSHWGRRDSCAPALTGYCQGQTASVKTARVSGTQDATAAGTGCCRASHLAGINAARKELVQLHQLVGSDVELERDAAERIIRSHLCQGTETIQTSRETLKVREAAGCSFTHDELHCPRWPPLLPFCLIFIFTAAIYEGR